MAHSYVVREKIDSSSGEKKVKFYAVPVATRQIDTRMLAEEIAEGSALSKGDVLAAICEIGNKIMSHLKAGDSVNLEGLGLFFLSAGSEGYESAEQCTPSRVKARRICFKSCNKQREELVNLKFERKKEI